MKRFAPVLIVLLAMLLASCSQRGFDSSLEIESRIIPGMDFSPYHNWKFARADQYPITNIAALDDPGFRESVGRSVVADMQKLGYTNVAENPDFVLMIHFVAESKFDEQKMADVYAGYDMAWAQMNSEDYWKEGNLMLFAMDAKTGKQVWSSTAKARLEEETDMETKKSRFKKTLSMMLEDFPPAVK
jgi:hypothetical protein